MEAVIQHAALGRVLADERESDMQDNRNEYEEQILMDLSTGKISLDDATDALCLEDHADTLRRLAEADLAMPNA